MELVGIILLIVGSVLFLMTKILGRKSHKKRYLEGYDEDFTSLLQQTWLLIKIMAAFLVASGIVLIMFL